MKWPNTLLPALFQARRNTTLEIDSTKKYKPPFASLQASALKDFAPKLNKVVSVNLLFLPSHLSDPICLSAMGVLLQRLATKAATLDMRLKRSHWAEVLSDECGLLKHISPCMKS